MFDSTSTLIRNKILLSIPQETLERWRPDLELIEAPLGMQLYRTDEPIKYVYFPESSLASILASTSNGQSCEVGIIGFEGGIGLQVVHYIQWNTYPVSDLCLGISSFPQAGIKFLLPYKFIQAVIGLIIAYKKYLTDILGDGGKPVRCR